MTRTSWLVPQKVSISDNLAPLDEAIATSTGKIENSVFGKLRAGELAAYVGDPFLDHAFAIRKSYWDERQVAVGIVFEPKNLIDSLDDLDEDSHGQNHGLLDSAGRLKERPVAQLDAAMSGQPLYIKKDELPAIIDIEPHENVRATENPLDVEVARSLTGEQIQTCLKNIQNRCGLHPTLALPSNKSLIEFFSKYGVSERLFKAQKKIYTNSDMAHPWSKRRNRSKSEKLSVDQLADIFNAVEKDLGQKS